MKTLLFLILMSVAFVSQSQDQKPLKKHDIIKETVKESKKTKQLVDSLILKIETKKWKRKDGKRYSSGSTNDQAKLNK